MKELAEIKIPCDLRYTSEHVWVRVVDDELHVGISDFAQDQLGEVSYVDLPRVGQRFATGDSFGTVESIKAVNSLFMPASGEVIAVNETLDESPTLVNVSCYEQGWMIRIRPDKADQVTALLSADAYRNSLQR